MERAAGEIIRSKTQPRNARGGGITPSRYRGKFKVNDTLLFFKSYRRRARDRKSGSSERTRTRLFSSFCRRYEAFDVEDRRGSFEDSFLLAFLRLSQVTY